MSLIRLPMCADLINQNYSDYSLLDIGCRTMALKPYLKGCKEYYGADLMPAEGVYECNLEEGLANFEDNSHDVVVALDVLEHLDNAHFVLNEMMRVARKGVFVSLPNMYYIRFRMNYLQGALSGKYTFPVDPVLDRHRWILSYDEALAFIDHNAKKQAKKNTVTHQDILPVRGRTKAIVAPVEKWLADKFPNLFVYASLSMIKFEDE